MIISLQTKIRSLMGLSCLETTKSFYCGTKRINLGCCAGIIGSAGKQRFFNFTLLVLWFWFTLKGSGSPTVQLTGGSGGPETFKCFFFLHLWSSKTWQELQIGLWKEIFVLLNYFDFFFF